MANKNEIPVVADLLNLDGRCALVTGASGNIGRGIAVRLAEAGADIVTSPAIADGRVVVGAYDGILYVFD